MTEVVIKISDTQINYKNYFDENNQYTVLIMHGWGGTSDSWTFFAEGLFNQGFNVLIPDLPGFGKTKINKIYTLDLYAELIEKFIKKIKIKNLILWGHSNGGAISIKLENRKNINLKQLILNNSAGIRNDEKRNFKRKVFKIIISPVTILFKGEWKKRNKIIKKIRILFYKIIGNNDYLKSENNPYLKQTYLNMISCDLTEEIKDINLNTLLIRGEKDTYTPLSDGQKMRKLIKKSKFVMLENQKHGIHLTSPELLLNTFLNNI